MPVAVYPLAPRAAPHPLSPRAVSHPLAGAPQPGAASPPTLIVVYSGANLDRNLFTDAGSPVAATNVIALVREGATVGSTNPASPAWRTGTGWAPGSQLYLVNRGVIAGAGGAGGRGGEHLGPPNRTGGGGGGGAGLNPGTGGFGPFTAADGAPGTELAGGTGGAGGSGTAGFADPIVGVDGGSAIGVDFAGLRIDNSLGAIRGGGGGGQGGGVNVVGAGIQRGGDGGPPGAGSWASKQFTTIPSGSRGGPVFWNPGFLAATILNEDTTPGTIVTGGVRELPFGVQQQVGATGLNYVWNVRDPELDFLLSGFSAIRHVFLSGGTQIGSVPYVMLLDGVPVPPGSTVQFTGNRQAGYVVTFDDPNGWTSGQFAQGGRVFVWARTRIGANPQNVQDVALADGSQLQNHPGFLRS